MEEYCEFHNIIVKSLDFGYKFKLDCVGVDTDKNFMIQCSRKIHTNLSKNNGNNIIDIYTLLVFYKEIISRQINDNAEVVSITFAPIRLILKQNEILMKIKRTTDYDTIFVDYDTILVDYTDIDRLHCILDLYPLLFLNRICISKYNKFVD